MTAERVGNDDWPSVTQVIYDLGLAQGSPYFQPKHRRRGRLVDACCNLIATGKAIPDEWWRGHSGEAADDRVEHEECRPYVDSCKRVLAETGIKVAATQVEVKHTDPRRPYIGHLDWWITEWQGSRWIFDLKCGYEEPWHPLQLAAYADCWLTTELPNRANLYLPSGKILHQGNIGRFPRDDVKDLLDWRTCIRFWWLKHERNG